MKHKSVKKVTVAIYIIMGLCCVTFILSMIGCATNYPENVEIAMKHYDDVRSNVHYKKGQKTIVDSQGNCVASSNYIIDNTVLVGVDESFVKAIILKRNLERHMAVRVYDTSEWWIVPSTGCIGEYAMTIDDYIDSCNNFNNSWWIVE